MPQWSVRYDLHSYLLYRRSPTQPNWLYFAEEFPEKKKEMKTTEKIGGYVISTCAHVVCFSLAFVALSSANSQSQARAFSFAERVAFQRIIEDVYWRHRIWPTENRNPKPSLDAVMSQAQLEHNVAGYLRDSLALENYWQKPITAEQLQEEMDRMARDTKEPDVLREFFESLVNA